MLRKAWGLLPVFLLLSLLCTACTSEFGESPDAAEEILYTCVEEDFIVQDGMLLEYLGPGGNVDIPKSVTSIEEKAFAGCDTLTKVNIPEGITRIGGGAFGACWALTSINIPKSVTDIGDMAFFYCTSLLSIEVAKHNAVYTSIDGVLFSKDKKTLLCYPGGKTARSYSVPKSVLNISSAAFMFCQSLKSINLPKNLEYIGEHAFDSCYLLTGVTIPQGTTSISEQAFAYCSSLNNIYIPPSVTYMGNLVFFECRLAVTINGASGSYAEEYAEENGVAFVALFPAEKDIVYASISEDFDIRGGVLMDYLGLGSEVTIPDGVTSIGNRAFKWCLSLTSVNISDAVTSIGEYAFYGCESLTSVIIPEGVTNIGEYAFAWCDSLTIHGVRGSYAEAFAREQNIPFSAK